MKSFHELKLLKEWLHGDPSNKVRLAGHFGYQTTQTIDRWFNRKKIPPAKREQLLKYIQKHPNNLEVNYE